MSGRNSATTSRPTPSACAPAPRSTPRPSRTASACASRSSRRSVTTSWSRMIRDEFDARAASHRLPAVEDRPLPGVSVALNLAGDRGSSRTGAHPTRTTRASTPAGEVAARIDARHLHAYAESRPRWSMSSPVAGMTISLVAWGGPWWSSPVRSRESWQDRRALRERSRGRAMTGEAEPCAHWNGSPSSADAS